VANFFLDQSIGIDKRNTFAVCSETNLRCAGISGICMPNPSVVALIVSEISAFIRTDVTLTNRKSWQWLRELF